MQASNTFFRARLLLVLKTYWAYSCVNLGASGGLVLGRQEVIKATTDEEDKGPCHPLQLDSTASNVNLHDMNWPRPFFVSLQLLPLLLVGTLPGRSDGFFLHSLFGDTVADQSAVWSSTESFSLQAAERSVPSESVHKIEDGAETDTVRVRIWKALASGDEWSIRDLGAAVGERRQGELRAHLKHVEKQAQTLRNKSMAWRERREKYV